MDNLKKLEVASKGLMIGGLVISGISALVNGKLQQLHMEKMFQEWTKTK